MVQTQPTKKKLLKKRGLNQFALVLLLSILLMGCNKTEKQQEILVGAAASLKPAMEELQTMYKEENPKVTVTFTFAGSGALEQQIREGAPMDVFFSAAEKQMNSLAEDELILKDTRVDLLNNQIVLIVPKESSLEITGFEDVLHASVIAIGDPASVPAGKYAQEVFTNLGIWEKVEAKATFAKDVTEVLTWVSTGNAEVGVVYKTDAMLSDQVDIVAYAPEDSHSKVIYPVAVVKASENEKAAQDFIDFLGTQKAKEVFVEYGFEAIN